MDIPMPNDNTVHDEQGVEEQGVEEQGVEEQGVEVQHSVNGDYAVPTTANVEESHLDLMPRAVDPSHAVDSSHPHDCDRATTNKDNQSKEVSDQSWLTRYQPNDIAQTDERLRAQDRSSAPPESLRVLGQQEAVRMNNYLDRFSADILPPPNLPVYLQILTYMQRWGLWAAHIQDDERRRELLKVIAEKMENVWLVGMQQGHIPQNLDELNAQNEEITATRPGANYQFNQKLVADILGTQGRGRHIQHHQRSKRVVSPSREIVIKSTWKGKPRYPITVGELEEAGLTMQEIEQRLLTSDLHDDHDLLEEMLQHLNRNICEGDWHGVAQRTTYDPIGRDLEMYCLWEMQSLRHDLRTLEVLKRGFKSASQVKNTEIRIDSVKTLYDRYAAVASLLHDKKKKKSLPRSRVENASPEPEIDSCTDAVSPDISIQRHQSQQPSGEAVSESGPATQDDESALVDLAEDTSSRSEQKLGSPVTVRSGAGPDEAAHLPRPPTIKLVMRKLIRLKTKPGFELEEYSACTVNNRRGFKFRYIKDSTIAERDSMDEVIDNYVERRIQFDREKRERKKYDQLADDRQRAHIPDRFGLYQILSLPDKANNENSKDNNNKPIVYGIWDSRNKKRVEGTEWFYNGKDGEWPIRTLRRDADPAHFLGEGFIIPLPSASASPPPQPPSSSSSTTNQPRKRKRGKEMPDTGRRPPRQQRKARRGRGRTKFYADADADNEDSSDCEWRPS